MAPPSVVRHQGQLVASGVDPGGIPSRDGRWLRPRHDLNPRRFCVGIRAVTSPHLGGRGRGGLAFAILPFGRHALPDIRDNRHRRGVDAAVAVANRIERLHEGEPTNALALAVRRPGVERRLELGGDALVEALEIAGPAPKAPAVVGDHQIEIRHEFRGVRTVRLDDPTPARAPDDLEEIVRGLTDLEGVADADRQPVGGSVFHHQ